LSKRRVAVPTLNSCLSGESVSLFCGVSARDKSFGSVSLPAGSDFFWGLVLLRLSYCQYNVHSALHVDEVELNSPLFIHPFVLILFWHPLPLNESIEFVDQLFL
jgi:hypothetical protein